MTKTCATCKHVKIESMSIPLSSYNNIYYYRYAKNVVYSQPEDKDNLVKFDLFTCYHPDRLYDDPVSGEKKSKGNMCTDLRYEGFSFCGLSGDKWEAKE